VSLVEELKATVALVPIIGAPVIFFGAALNTGSSAITAQNPFQV
jgi:hypothetical protein